MGTLTIAFQGICVHMTEMRPYRIITLAGSMAGDPFFLAPTIRIPGGITLPCLPPATNGSFLLRGATFTIRNATNDLLDTDLGCLPELSKFPFTQQLNESAASGEQAPAAAYFDIQGGRISFDSRNARCGVAYTNLDVDFPGDEATLTVRCWNGGAAQDIVIPNLPQTIIVNNVPPSALVDDPLEFLNSFLIAEPMSAFGAAVLGEIVAALDKMSDCLKTRFGTAPPPYDTFPSCSNSQWP